MVGVSDGKDWIVVRVELGSSDYFGAVYATNGFIYGQPVELGPPTPQIVDVVLSLRERSGGVYVVDATSARRRGAPVPEVINVAEYLSSHCPAARRTGEVAP
jgi:hypothetical protein